MKRSIFVASLAWVLVWTHGFLFWVDPRTVEIVFWTDAGIIVGAALWALLFVTAESGLQQAEWHRKYMAGEATLEERP